MIDKREDNYFEDVLLRLGQRCLEIGTHRDSDGKLRLVFPFPAWDIGSFRPESHRSGGPFAINIALQGEFSRGLGNLQRSMSLIGMMCDYPDPSEMRSRVVPITRTAIYIGSSSWERMTPQFASVHSCSCA
jgi:hypothetical protein